VTRSVRLRHWKVMSTREAGYIDFRNLRSGPIAVFFGSVMKKAAPVLKPSIA
jgi:hypothetical protein